MRLRANVIGVGAAGLMLILIAYREAPWWVFSIGEVASLKLSPFKVSLELAGHNVVPPIIDYVTLGAWLVTLLGAVLIVVGSFSRRAWSKSLVSFGLSKLAWELAAIIIVPALLYLATSSPLRGLLLGSIAGLLGPNVEVLSAEAPLLVGQGALRLAIRQALEVVVTLPLSAYVTPQFYIASACLGLCIAARMYQGRLVAQELQRKRGAELAKP
ncbi:MAG: hypothetical protein N3H31_03825 [Candidatus Nezhaarchaeota archaeon]|nr:hypothetical protein [Candidatus Nezhaarchaeota archaeon]